MARKAARKEKTKRERRTSQPRYAEAARLRSEILDLRILGRTIVQIGQAVNRSPAVVHKHLTTAIQDLDDEQREQAGRYRALAYARLERLLGKAMLKGAGGDLLAMREANRMITTQARIMGFDAPIKHANTDPTGEHEREPPGTWTLPAIPVVTIAQWQREAAKSWGNQQQSEASAESAAAPMRKAKRTA